MSYTYNDALFRQQMPEFANATTYPQATLAMYFGMATDFMASSDATALAGDTMVYALNLMTAHIAKSNALLSQGVNNVVVTGSTEGSVSVSLAPPPAKDAFQFWLATTSYGLMLRALLKAKSMVLQYAGGSVERAAFRKAGGVF